MVASDIINQIRIFCPGLQTDIMYSILNKSYLTLSRMEWNAMKVTRTLTTRPPYSVGTIDIDASGNVSPSVGSLSVFAAWMQGCWLRVFDSNAFWLISTYTSPAAMVLQDWGEGALTSQTFVISKTIYSFALPFSVFDVTYNIPLSKKTQSFFNSFDPSRLVTGSPLFWADAGVDSSNYPTIEIFPRPDTSYPLKVYGKLTATTLVAASLPILPPELLESHALRECYLLKDRLDPKHGWDAKAKEELGRYNELYSICRDEDYIRGATPDRVKDVYDRPLYPLDDSFRTAHDVD